MRVPRFCLKSVLGAVALCSLLAACDSVDWFDQKTPILPGKRISILTKDQDVQPETTPGQAVKIMLPPPEPNADWPQAGGNASHAMQHMVVNKHLHQAWSSNAGSGSGSRAKLLSQPIVAGGRIFTVDSQNVVTALKASNGDRLWQVNLTPEDIEGASSGGLSYDEGRLYVSTGFAQIVSLDARSGKVLWRQTLSGPIRGAPTARAGRVVVITVDDHTYCLAADDGQTLWTHQGTVEQASLLAGNSAAIDGNTVIVPYSSGELFALRIENGSVLWQDQVANVSKYQGVATLADITGRPIVDRGKVYVMGHADTLAALDLRSGRRLWEREIGGMQSPWIAGEYLFTLTYNNEAVALDSKTGRILWVTQLQSWGDPEKKKDRIVWSGPVLASNRLIVGSSTGILASLSPYTGDVLGQIEISAGISVPPVVANGTLYFYTDEADVVAYR